ncbi:unnamed protein product [Rotaria socialis]|uniref:Septin-type G domain-containing protein n=1 Tax=Rotaria socialis TaxID=392032 RepID=A0A818FV72_9BILA|nr:unnamed protein product [Rotaria socialis]CAF3479368.1 unnamed protein product [Rotaria socialis]
MISAAGVQSQNKSHNNQQSDSTTDFIGFGNLPNQIHRKLAKRGFELTLMVVGESGLGKTTLINSLFQRDLHSQQHLSNAAPEQLYSSIKIEPSTIDIEECGVKVRLTIINTPGYGDSINCTDNYKSILNYIDNQFELYFDAESGLNRRSISDNRVHCLFYFISSLARGLKPLDIECMKALHHKVNIIPIIAKADALTSDELIQMKQNIIEQIHGHHIQIYQIPDCDADEDEELKEKNIQLKSCLPFAIISSTQCFEAKGKQIYGRIYPWGLIDIEDSNHSDFLKLRNMLIIHMQDLQQVTHEFHYENYRLEKLQLKKYDGPQRKLLQEKDNELRRMQDLLCKVQGQLAGKL